MKGFDDMVCVREEEVRGRRVRRGYLWQGGAEISQYRAEHAGGEGAKHPSSPLILFLHLPPLFLLLRTLDNIGRDDTTADIQLVSRE